ncbi:MAG TPA: adenylate/guanylate cyclase domain-containing protein [Rectinemataceae bacterium]|nr:adenylate/guanylate cyclase domain-containing protein [Rectinemataceae bacterium]
MAKTVEEGPGTRHHGDVAKLREGERRVVTILFADMKGFTAFSERSDPEDVDSLISGIFARFESMIAARGGSVEKYIGDALVAVFGYPEMHEDDPCRALEASLDFLGTMEREGGPVFRIGIHTGLVATGRRGGFDVVTGHTMAVASRLEASAPPGFILCSATTREACEKRFVFGERLDLELAGKEEGIAAYRVLARRRSAPVFEGPFLGRDGELDRLVGFYLRGLRDDPCGVYVLGDGGIGKTRLCAELVERLHRFPEWKSPVLYLNPAQAGGAAYAAVARAVAAQLGLEGGDIGKELAAAAEGRLGLERSTSEIAAAALGAGLLPAGARLGGPSPATMLRDPSELRSLVAFLDALFGEGSELYPSLIVLDNASALDPASRALFRLYLVEAKHRPLFLLADRHPDEGLAALFRCTERLCLGPLSDAVSALLVRSLGPEGLAEREIDLVVRRAQGYPLFIEEYVKHLGRNRAVDGIPETIQSTVLASVEGFDPPTRMLLGALSVFRYPFAENDVAQLLARIEAEGRSDLGNSLAFLEEERLLSRLDDGRYRFRHTIIRDAIYGSLLNHNKRILHQAAAEMAEEREAPPAEIFWHLASGGHREEARRLLFATRPVLSEDYAGLIQDLLDHAAPDEAGAKVDLLFFKYAIAFNSHARGGVEETMREMYDIALRERNPAYLARVCHLYVSHCTGTLELERAIYFGDRALSLYAKVGDPRGDANVRSFLVRALLLRGDFERAETIIEGMERGNDFCDWHYAGARYLFHLMRGDYAEAEVWRGKAADLGSVGGMPQADAELRYGIVSDCPETLEFAKALEVAESGSPDKSEMEGLIRYYVALAYARAALGETSRAETGLAEVDRLFALSGDPALAVAGLPLMTRALALLGRRDEARSRALTGLAGATAAGNWVVALDLYVFLGEMALEDKKLADSVFWQTEAAALFERPVYRSRKTALRYHLLRWDLALERGGEGRDRAEAGSTDAEYRAAKEEAQSAMEEARRLFGEENAALGSEEARRALREIRAFAPLLES